MIKLSITNFLKNNKKYATIIVVIVFLLLSFFSAVYLKNTYFQEDYTNIKELKGLSLKNFDGKIVVLTDINADVVVLSLWASWCSFCGDELAWLSNSQENFSEDIAIVAVNRAEPFSPAKSYIDKLGLNKDSILFLLDSEDSLYRAINGFSMPETLFIDKYGFIKLHKRGPIEQGEFEEIIKKIIEDQKIWLKIK